MSGPAAQLTFELPHRPALDRADLLVSACNEIAVAWLDRWPDWPSPALCIHGPPACGKSHLAAAWSARSGAELVTAEALGGRSPAERAAAGPVAIDRADDSVDERYLLHLLNSVRETGATVVMTASAPPARWPVGLPDLASRLRAMPAVAVGRPDEALLAAVMAKQFSDRQVRVAPQVISFLVQRLERSFVAARQAVERLDQLALVQGSAITLAMARNLINELQDVEQAGGG